MKIKDVQISTTKILDLITQLAVIPSPSHHEEKKAEFVKNYFTKLNYPAVIDEVYNVIVSFGDESKPKTVFIAHTDTVFPFDTKLSPTIKDGKLYCPSCDDDSAGVAGLMLAAKYILDNNVVFPDTNVVFVFSTGEEGLGNLKGSRAYFEKATNVKECIAVDGSYTHIEYNSVGSYRYEISVHTKGGHSFGNFGNPNAIHVISNIISELYKMQIPQVEGAKTTFNVGKIEGGTTVNSIAENASCLFEYRSDNYDCVMNMKSQFERIIESFKSDEYEIEVKVLGIRPCSNGVDQKAWDALIERVTSISESITGITLKRETGSMDFNIPLSMGIPSTSTGISISGGVHTVNEWLYIDSLELGMKVLMNIILSYAE